MALGKDHQWVLILLNEDFLGHQAVMESQNISSSY